MSDSMRGWAFGGIVGQHAHLLRTIDGGWTWRDVSPPVPRPDGGKVLLAAGSFLDGETARVVFYTTGADIVMYSSQGPPPELRPLVVWFTGDGGATWSESRAGEVWFVGNGSLVPLVQFADPTHGWIVIRHVGIGMHTFPVDVVATGDGGETWVWKHDTSSDDLLDGGGKSGFALGDPSIGFATIEDYPVDGAQMDWTFDGGLTWQGRRPPSPADQPEFMRGAYCNADSPQFVSPSQAFAAAACGSDEGPASFLFHTGDAGSTWETLRYPGGELLFIDADNGWALGRDIYRTTDAGLHWVWVKTVNWDGQFSFVSPNEGWAVARSDEEIALVHTLDGGASWELLKPIIGP